MRRRSYRSPIAPRPRRQQVAIAVAARPAPSLRWVLLLAIALLLALVLPRIAAAAPAGPTLELGADAAIVRVEAAPDADVQVVWGLAPNAARTLRSAGGPEHAIALQGLEPGRIYVYRVYVDGVPLTEATPFRTPGEPPPAAAIRL